MCFREVPPAPAAVPVLQFSRFEKASGRCVNTAGSLTRPVTSSVGHVREIVQLMCEGKFYWQGLVVITSQ